MFLDFARHDDIFFVILNEVKDPERENEAERKRDASLTLSMTKPSPLERGRGCVTGKASQLRKHRHVDRSAVKWRHLPGSSLR